MSKFVIDNSRGDSFYHYKKYDDSGNLMYDRKNKPVEGWALYDHMKTPEDKRAWKEGVEKYLDEKPEVITISKKCKIELEKWKDALELDPKTYPEKRDLVMPSVSKIAEMIASISGSNVDCTDEFISQIMEICNGDIPTTKNMIKYAWNSTVYNLDIDWQILKDDFISLGVNGFAIPCIELIEQLIDTFFSTIDFVYNEIIRLYANVIYAYRCITRARTSEEKQAAKEKFLKLLKSLDPEIADFIMLIISGQIITQIVETAKNLWHVAKDAWKGLVEQLKSIVDIDIDLPTWKQLKPILFSLIPVLLAFIGAVIAAQCKAEEEIDNSANALPDEGELDKNIQATIEYYSDEGVIYNYAAHNLNDYSLYPKYTDSSSLENNDSNNNVSIDSSCLCKVSMCNPYVPTDINSLYGDLGEKHIIIEFSKSLNCKLCVKNEQIVRINDVICYIDDIPVKAKFDFKILKNGIEDDHIIFADYYFDEVLLNSLDDPSKIKTVLNDKINASKENPVEEISNMFNLKSKVDTFIKDYISFFRYSDLAEFTREHTEANTIAISTDDFIKIYEDEAHEIIDEYHETIKTICQKDHVQTTIENSDVNALKTELDDAKTLAFNNILSLYKDNPGSIKYCSKGRICDFMLYSKYIDYVYSDNYNYDEDNPYIVRLNSALNNIIGQRTRLELNINNIDALKYKFNEFCDTVIKQYWKYTDISYYDKLNELFKFDYYVDSTDILEASESDDHISLYKRVLNWLKALSKYTPAEQKEIVIDENTNPNDILASQGSEGTYDEKTVKLEKDLKQIAYRFISIKQIEEGLISTDVKYYDPKGIISIVNKFTQLNSSLIPLINEYATGDIILPTSLLYPIKNVLDEYIKIFKKITSEESRILSEIANDCIKYYYANSDQAIIDKLIKDFKEVTWPNKATVYNKTTEYDYLLFVNNAIPSSDPIRFKYYDSLPDDMKDLYNAWSDPHTKYDITTYQYWLKYCGMATIVNCMMPIYWSTGLVIAGAPVLLPIIYIPCMPPILAGPVLFVIGIGLCGIMPGPMIIEINLSGIPGCVLAPVNMIIDTIIKSLKNLTSFQKDALKGIITPMIVSLDKDIEKTIDDIDTINYQIDEIKNTKIVNSNEKQIKKKLKIDSTTKAENKCAANNDTGLYKIKKSIEDSLLKSFEDNSDEIFTPIDLSTITLEMLT